MINKNYTIELLAPAKNKECAFAAINAGADAVYIGADSFGARKKAGNSLEDIAQIVEYAHKFLVKIYVTVNTILYDNEIKEAEKLGFKKIVVPSANKVKKEDYTNIEIISVSRLIDAITACVNK